MSNYFFWFNIFFFFIIFLLYGETVENHVGNQQIGNEVEDGISYDQLKIIKDGLKKNGYKCKFHDLGDLLKARDKDNTSKAGFLVVKNFVNTGSMVKFIQIYDHNYKFIKFYNYIL